MKAYVASPMDLLDKDGAWYTENVSALARKLREEAVGAFLPHEYDYGEAQPFELLSFNMERIAASDILIAVWRSGTDSVGIPIEMFVAWQQDMPILMLCDQKMARSKMLDAMDVSRYLSIDDLMKAVGLWRERAGFDSPERLDETPWRYEFTRHHEHTKVPTQAHQGDAGYDLYATELVRIPARQYGEIRTGLRCAPPPGVWSMVVGRSSSFKRGLLVNTAIVDNGYRGDLNTAVFNLATQTQVIEPGARIAQLVPMPLVPDLPWKEVDTLPVSERGESGYGSTGT